MKKDPVLSKSKYMTGLQCPKLLWMSYHAKDQFPETDPQTQAIFDQGNDVTALARTLFPDGIEIEGVEDYEAILKKTQELLPKRKPLFEAAFSYKNTFARPDILSPNKDGSWDLHEVKSSTAAKDIHYHDLAFQKYCYEGAGLKIRRSHLILINNQYVKQGEIDPNELFSRQDVSGEVNSLVAGVEKNIGVMLKNLQQKTCPEIKIGPYCNDPYPCDLQDLCWSFLPDENIFILNRIRKEKAFELLAKKILGIADLPDNATLTPSQQIQRECHRTKERFINKAAIKGFLDQLELPIYFLDFETVNPAIPFYDQSRPYQNIPFQFSLHILSDWDKRLQHHGFLAIGRRDPRPELLKMLKDLLENQGSIVSYNMNFELTRLRECVETFPEYRGWFKKIEKRFLDLIVPFRKFDYYDPKQMGRTSIKNVFPALTGGSYKELDIAEGGIASLEFARITFQDGISTEEKARIRQALKTYCKLDTQAMIDVLNVLRRVVL
ncbi:MAG: hypothetical protein A3G33_06115 [Omnitrophica bacterium RIFCSPLOWO2_12_FULL_44_17]|uniref:DUF2779 domain-containing protein n=1 Tax=Candidatus Danuiimicrobium aquiferis TaxID=1801832 RepID=A0A1G1KS26_9BACT|nr:MAG: hypothetical protein A3B72_02605 [Omnitrophica bacterium RIFCSPHIGHO2_02_FULL_45_28]OGW90790.1 MAG: hypothetical protein A3E74_01020 [Omnitrophica bacterium RIFCSPHIGHO2_12_FULL_44_12]OGW95359.1 MAG: hypothetical protein A3G33_06115 [Omnitrophica bacterium RIFCSPLOWO2_12_FULL_44_17]